jgi:hypothetical protein
LEENKLKLNNDLYNKSIKWINNIRYHQEDMNTDHYDTITVDSNLVGTEVVFNKKMLSPHDISTKVETHRQIKTILDDIRTNVLNGESKLEGMRKENLSYRQVRDC